MLGFIYSFFCCFFTQPVIWLLCDCLEDRVVRLQKQVEYENSTCVYIDKCNKSLPCFLISYCLDFIQYMLDRTVWNIFFGATSYYMMQQIINVFLFGVLGFGMGCGLSSEK